MKLLLLSFMAFWQSFDNSFLELLTSRDEQARAYIATYNELAVLQMHEAGIPASITLAQGMYESGFGNSELTEKLIMIIERYNLNQYDLILNMPLFRLTSQYKQQIANLRW
ncbi:MAG: glucosaminidase domain-containing protein [Sphingobacteriales bacterium]|nr:glucosaminidase domain-containing protein [Sphingobacteriales bacterium]